MNRFTRSAALLALLSAAAPLPVVGADSAADSKYSYRPYSQQNPAGSDPASSPANTAGRPPSDIDNRNPGDASPDRDDRSARGNRAGYQPPPAPEAGDPNQSDDGPPPAARRPVTQGGVPATRIEAMASAPDRSVPYNVREQDARRAAIAAWRSKAAQRFGAEFSHWRMAERRHVNCVRNSSDDAVCTVSGVPVRGMLDALPGRGDGRFDGPDGGEPD